MKNVTKMFYKRVAIPVLLVLFVVISASLSGCEEDEEEKVEPKVKCLVCEGGSDDTLCEGDIDPDSGEEVTLEILEVARDLANAFGGDCSLVDQ